MAAWSAASQGWLGRPRPPSQPNGQLPEMEAQETRPRQLHASKAHTNGRPSQEAWFPGTRLLLLFIFFFFEMQTKCILSTRLNRHPKGDLVFVQGQSTSVDVVNLPHRPVPCQGSTLEKLVLWKHKLGGSLTPSSSTPLNAQMYFFHAYA